MSISRSSVALACAAVALLTACAGPRPQPLDTSGDARLVEQAILSQHLTLMRDKGLLGVEKEGKYSFYYLEQPGFLKIIKDLENCCEHL